MANNSEKSERYRSFILSEYDTMSVNSRELERIEVAAEKTALFGDIQRKKSQSQQATFFGNGLIGGTMINNNNNSKTEINVYGNNTGSIAVSQDSIVNVKKSVQEIQDDRLKGILNRLLTEIETNQSLQHKELLDNIESMAKAPNKTVADKIIQYLGVYNTIASVPLITSDLAQWVSTVLN